ncbi:MAG: FliM/FliN family flagellar motor switch protein [Myxococcales bacterium]|nr:FliM/FliN family flagellar motor switch protein [Myxococcales bacterium]MCB9521975.1 FliM/FliN family flagellar motor switch protein [Myxococcales bacterium]
MSDVLSQEELNALFEVMGRPVEPTAPPRAAEAQVAALGIAARVKLDVAVEIGRTRLTLAELHRLAPGDNLVLDRPMATRLPLTVAGRVVARGQPVAVEEHFALRVETGPDDLPP